MKFPNQNHETPPTTAGGRFLTGPLVISSSFTLATLLGMFVIRLHDDEGMLAYQFAQVLFKEPLAAWFFQKLRPIGSLLMAPWAMTGFTVFLIGQKIWAGLGIYFLGLAVDRLGGKGWLASLIVASSPMYVVSSMAGHANIQGVAIAALAMALLAYRKFPWGAGLLVGLLPWVRYEYVFFSAVLAGYALFEWRRPGFFIACAAFPLFYLLTGMMYHEDFFWMAHYPPSLITPEPDSEAFVNISWSFNIFEDNIFRLSFLCPFWPLLAIRPLRGHGLLGKSMWLLLASCLAILIFFPLFKIFKFDYSLRYWLLILIPCAFLLAAPSKHARPLPWLGAFLLAASGAIVGAMSGASDHFAFTLLIVSAPLAYLLIVNFAAQRKRILRAALLGLLVVAGLCSNLEVLANIRKTTPADSDHKSALAWLEEKSGNDGLRDIYTNSHMLQALLDDADSPLAPHVKYLAQYDVHYELYHLLNKANGQYKTFLGAFAPILNGHAVWACRLANYKSFANDVFIIFDDNRFNRIYPPAFIKQIADPVKRTGSYQIFVGKAALPKPAGELGMRLESDLLAGPCKP
ncbi:MAG: hypothetical protein C4523_06195 [Myxococcales bacterium]|nr:MAG: hypothetical protein C4523_06195 [Myxococcales bacterium]